MENLWPRYTTIIVSCIRMAYYLFFFRRFWVKEPRHSETIFASKKVHLYGSTRLQPKHALPRSQHICCNFKRFVPEPFVGRRGSESSTETCPWVLRRRPLSPASFPWRLVSSRHWQRSASSRHTRIDAAAKVPVVSVVSGFLRTW